MNSLSTLYRHMSRARAFELAVARLWHEGCISGEMHLGTGEEAVAAGVVSQLGEGDALALTHRPSPAMVVRGVPLLPMLEEMLGHRDGLAGGMAGHMHLMSKAHRTVSSGIVGASLPAGAGFALAAKRLRPGSVSVAFTGDGAMNAGMALETMNLAAAWKLPVVVVCIDNGWAITTASETVTGGDLETRASAFGWNVRRADGSDVQVVHEVTAELLQRVRGGGRPGFLYVPAPRLDGHFLGDPLGRMVHDPLGPLASETLGRVFTGLTEAGGASVGRRAWGMTKMAGSMVRARMTPQRDSSKDPIVVARSRMSDGEWERIDGEARREIDAAVALALAKGDRQQGPEQHA